MPPSKEQVLEAYRGLKEMGRSDDEIRAILADRITPQTIEEDVEQPAQRGGVRGKLDRLSDLLFGLDTPTPSVPQKLALEVAQGFLDTPKEIASALALVPDTAREYQEGPKTFPLVDLPIAAGKAVYKSIPEGQKAEGVTSALAGLGSMAIPGAKLLKRPIAKAATGMVSSVAGGELARQAKELLGMAPDTGLKEAAERVTSATAKGAGMLGAGALAGKGINPALLGVEEKLRGPSRRLAAFRDRARQRLLAFSDSLGETQTRQGKTMYKALDTPEMKKLIEVDPESTGPYSAFMGDGSRFPVIARNVREAIAQTGEKLDDLVDKASFNQAGNKIKIKLKDIDLSKIENRIKGIPGEPEGTARAARTVWDNEMDNFAKRALSDVELRQYQSAKSILRSYEQGHGKPLNITTAKGARAEAKIVQEVNTAKAVVAAAEKKIMNQEFTLEEVRKFKTDFSSRGRYDRAHDADAENQADVYREFGHGFRKKLAENIELDKDLAKEYQQTIDHFETLMDFKPILNGKLDEFHLYGEHAKTGAFRDRERGALGIVKSTLYPHAAAAESRLAFADTRPYRTQSRGLLNVAQGALENVRAPLRVATKTTEGVGRLSETVPGGALAGAYGTLNAEGGSLPPPIPSALPAPAEAPLAAPAAAPEPTPLPIQLPRDSEAFFQAPIEAFGNLPPEAQKLVMTAKGSSPRVKRKALTEIMKLDTGLEFAPVPHEWLQGYKVVDGRIEDELEAVAFGEDVLEREKAGQVTQLQSAKIRSALNAGEPIVAYLNESFPKGEIKAAPAPAPAEVSSGGEKRLGYDF